MAKSHTEYICENCGYKTPKWMGQCPACKEWSTLVEQAIVKAELDLVHELTEQEQGLMELGEVELTALERISTGFSEFDRVLGGGLVAGQVVLLHGEPGIGKSTLLMQVASMLNETAPIVYASAEESLAQIRLRANRIFGKKDSYFLVTNSSEIHDLMDQFLAAKAKYVVIDSIQTVFDREVSSLPGSIAQVKSAAIKLVKFAKQRGISMVIVGQINKDGDVAGPKVLEHLVDTVISYEGEERQGYRMLRATKNRFGSVGEVGLMRMGETGLVDMSELSELFVGKSEPSIGIARTIVMDGSRPLIVEIQALAAKTIFQYPKRVAEGISASRVQMICAVVSKFAKLGMSDYDIYIKVSGGYKVGDPVADAAIAKAIVSSVKKVELPVTDLYLGELNLAGKFIPPSRLELRLKEAARYGCEAVYANHHPGLASPAKIKLQALKL